jgi:hypothetical protein
MQKKPSTKFSVLSDKSSEETRNRKNVPQENKGYIRQAYSQHHTKWEKLKPFSLKSGKHKGVNSLYFYST